jgi:phosphonate degradation associated HDIG domain protein
MGLVVLEILNLFKNFGESEYGGEEVNQIEHALQSAHFAEEAGEKETLILACLLHDIGHLLHQLPNDAPEQGIDDLHENLGYHYLEKKFPPSVAEPVKLHVPAKRYLCTKEPNYIKILSKPSIISLHLQGGPMTQEECIQFEKNTYYLDAIKLRKYDDMAKIRNFPTNSIDYYEPLIKNYIHA